MARILCEAFVFLVLVAISSQFILDKKNANITNELDGTLLEKTRRKPAGKKSISTSSSEYRASGSESRAADESLDLSTEQLTTSEEEVKKRIKYVPVSSAERKGWRKWHRKCTPCPADMAKKWRDPSIKWICGAYQQARRSFKSICMMHYRNCQDGTMFTKVYEHRCANDTESRLAHGDHFFYEYKVVMTDEESASRGGIKDYDYSNESRDTEESSEI